MSKPRTAIYARHSTDKQNPMSSSDQADACVQLVERLGGKLVGTFTDPEISGYSRKRPGLMQLLTEVRDGSIDVIVTESLDRFARDGEDIAWLGKKLRFSRVKLVTAVEGEIDEIKLAVAGMLGSMYLTNLQKKTFRGMEAAVLAGHFAGGRAYGYRRVIAHDARGEVIRGVLEIDPAEADIVKRICTEFAAGRSSIQIATGLNADGEPGPRKRYWNASTVRGDPTKLVGIINNPLYRGRLVWGRREWRRDPDTEMRERRYRLRDSSEWKEFAVPDLRIIDDNLAAAIDASLAKRSRSTEQPRLDRHRRSRHLLSGLIVCGCCGSNYTISGKDYYRCAGQKERGTCRNMVSVRVTPLEDAVLSSLQTELLTPEFAKLFATEFNREVERLERSRSVTDDAAIARIKIVDVELEMLAANLATGIVGPTLAKRLSDRETEREELVARIAEKTVPVAEPLLTNGELAELFSGKVSALRLSLADPVARTEASEVLRDLLESVTILPDAADGPVAEIAARPARLIQYAQDATKPRRRTGGAKQSSVMVVAGTRIGRCTASPVVIAI